MRALLIFALVASATANWGGGGGYSNYGGQANYGGQPQYGESKVGGSGQQHGGSGPGGENYGPGGYNAGQSGHGGGSYGGYGSGYGGSHGGGYSHSHIHSHGGGYGGGFGGGYGGPGGYGGHGGYGGYGGHGGYGGYGGHYGHYMGGGGNPLLAEAMYGNPYNMIAGGNFNLGYGGIKSPLNVLTNAAYQNNFMPMKHFGYGGFGGMDNMGAYEVNKYRAQQGLPPLDEDDMDEDGKPDHLVATRHKIDDYINKQWKLGKRKLTVHVTSNTVPLEYQYLSQYHGFPNPLAGTPWGSKVGQSPHLNTYNDPKKPAYNTYGGGGMKYGEQSFYGPNSQYGENYFDQKKNYNSYGGGHGQGYNYGGGHGHGQQGYNPAQHYGQQPQQQHDHMAQLRGAAPMHAGNNAGNQQPYTPPPKSANPNESKSSEGGKMAGSGGGNAQQKPPIQPPMQSQPSIQHQPTLSFSNTK